MIERFSWLMFPVAVEAWRWVIIDNSPPKVDGFPKPASSTSTRITFGALFGACTGFTDLGLTSKTSTNKIDTLMCAQK